MSGENIILTGFMATGKSQVGREVARRLGWQFVDTDDIIVSKAGRSIPDIFSQHGETAFRDLESQALADVCALSNVVVATGGGIVQRKGNRSLMLHSGIVICLDAQPDTIYRRVLAEVEGGGDIAARPLLAVDDPLERIRSLKAQRQPFYAAADWTVATDQLSPDEVASEAIRAWELLRRRRPGRQEASSDSPACVVTTSTASYPIHVGWNELERLGQRMRSLGLSGAAFVVSDDRVLPLYGEKVEASLQEAGFRVASMAVPAGEPSKCLAEASRIYDWLVSQGAERGHALVAVGGGVVGDLAGFVAATYLRGIPFIQVPTSLLAMVDASVGGKVAVDLPQGKNLVGAFYQPRLVAIDVSTLQTLGPRHLTEGWSELIKHGLILDADLFSFLEAHADSLLRLEREVTVQAVARSVAIKARVVSEDEKETGLRTVLNYGHTIAHALETATEYNALLHGEAVAIGIRGAARIGRLAGITPEEVVVRQDTLLDRMGLPSVPPRFDMEAALAAMQRDKKVRAGAIRWVMLEELGRATVRSDIPLSLVTDVLKSLAG